MTWLYPLWYFCIAFVVWVWYINDSHVGDRQAVGISLLWPVLGFAFVWRLILWLIKAMGEGLKYIDDLL